MDKKTRKTPKKISKKYLENAALYYLQRYATSAENLRRVLTGKIGRSCRFYKTPAEEFLPLVEDLIKRYIASGLLNDAVYARAKTSSLRRRGKSSRAIQAVLQQKGLDGDKIKSALRDVDENEEAELQAAIVLAKRKKIGPFRTGSARDQHALQKDLAILGRAGFSYETASRALRHKGEDG